MYFQTLLYKLFNLIKINFIKIKRETKKKLLSTRFKLSKKKRKKRAARRNSNVIYENVKSDKVEEKKNDIEFALKLAFDHRVH